MFINKSPKDIVKVINISKAACSACYIQYSLLKETEYQYFKYYYDTEKDRQFAKKNFSINDEDDVPVFILFVGDKEIYRTLVPLTPERINTKLNEVDQNGKQERLELFQ
jgi:hypothetical protein